MYKHLHSELSSTNATIKELILIAFEIENNEKKDFIEDLENRPTSYICDVFDWSNEKKAIEFIENALKEDEISILDLAYDNKRTGFLTCVHFNLPQKVGKLFGYSSNYYQVEYVYADTLCELVYKIKELSDDIDRKEKEKQKNNI